MLKYLIGLSKLSLFRLLFVVIVLIQLQVAWNIANAAGCTAMTSEVVQEVGDIRYIRGSEDCASSLEAKNACIAWVEGLGFGDSGVGQCHSGYVTIGSDTVLLWQAGWLKGPSIVSNYPFSFYLSDFHYPQYFVSALPEKAEQCGVCVGDPVNPVNGAVFSEQKDVQADSVEFSRHFNSASIASGPIGSGWSTRYSRRVEAKSAAESYKPWTQTNNSSKYSDPATACTSGFAQVKPKVANWASAVASYTNGLCSISKNGVLIGTLKVYSNVAAPFGGPTLIAADAIRDDGQQIRFSYQNGVLNAPPSISLQLQVVASGYMIIDSEDNIEQYDSAGKLLSITRRAGVTETVAYDAQGRLLSVTRQ